MSALHCIPVLLLLTCIDEPVYLDLSTAHILRLVTVFALELSLILVIGNCIALELSFIIAIGNWIEIETSFTFGIC